MAKICIFDLDGTLLDSLADIQHALNTALAENGLPSHDTDSVRRMVGHGLAELVRQAVPSQTPAKETVPPVLARLREIYREIPYRHSQPYPGIPDLLIELKAKGTIMAVLTNKSDPIAQIIVSHFFPGIFDLVQGESPELPRKPDPESLWRLLASLAPLAGLPLGQRENLGQAAVLIGDSEADIQTAHAAGVRAIGVDWGFRSSNQLLAAGATEIVTDCAALRRALA